MRILLLGSGAREHALARSLAADPATTELVIAPGNPGTSQHGTNMAVDPTNPQDVLALAWQMQADLAVVGPEAPLMAGVADTLREAGVLTFGPGAEAARLEGSKGFAKEVMAAAGVPTAQAAVCTTLAEVDAALDRFGPPHVVKEGGLAAGKGVVLTPDRDAARADGLACLSRSGGRGLVEEYLDGPEVSLFCVCDGASVRPWPRPRTTSAWATTAPAPTPGAWGPAAPWTVVPRTWASRWCGRSPSRWWTRWSAVAPPSSGCSTAGWCSPAGACGWWSSTCVGDPETQAVLARLTSSPPQLLHAAATGRLDQVPTPTWSPQAAVDVVLAAPGYPGAVTTGGLLTGI